MKLSFFNKMHYLASYIVSSLAASSPSHSASHRPSDPYYRYIRAPLRDLLARRDPRTPRSSHVAVLLNGEIERTPVRRFTRDTEEDHLHDVLAVGELETRHRRAV